MRRPISCLLFGESRAHHPRFAGLSIARIVSCREAQVKAFAHLLIFSSLVSHVCSKFVSHLFFSYP